MLDKHFFIGAFEVQSAVTKYIRRSVLDDGSGGLGAP